MEEVNVLNIPAFQRKRSISAKEKKLSSPSSLRPSRKIRSRTGYSRVTRTKTRTRTKISTPISEFEEPIIQSPFRSSLPSEELFPSPIIEETNPYNEPICNTSAFREMQTCGRCEGYFDKIDVAVIQLTSSIRIGESIIFETDNGLFEQEIASMQINRQDIEVAHAGDDIGLKVLARPKVGGSVYKVI